MPNANQIGQYRIIRRLGAGGMAEVFLAEKAGAAGFSVMVAIKTILAGGAPPDSISLFLDEARVASVLHHSGIVQTLDLGFENETLFIVMEYVAGPPLSRLIFEMKRQKRFLSPHLVAYVGAKIANALDYAHRRVTAPDGRALNLIHRDVSPQNILVTRDAVVKLTDFGVARASIQMHKTKTGQVRGKAAYMAPEQVRAKDLDGRTDMFALGLVLYEALTGVRAYQRKSDIQSMRAILSDKVTPIHDSNPSVPDDLVQVIMKTLEKKPAGRYNHCSELEQALTKTYAHMRESAIEKQITDLMDELFGQQKWGEMPDGPSVEAWQPTLNIDKDGKVKAPKLNRLGGDLSPEVAAMLGQTPQRSKSAPTDPSGGMQSALQGRSGGYTELAGDTPLLPVQSRGPSETAPERGQVPDRGPTGMPMGAGDRGPTGVPMGAGDRGPTGVPMAGDRGPTAAPIGPGGQPAMFHGGGQITPVGTPTGAGQSMGSAPAHPSLTGAAPPTASLLAAHPNATAGGWGPLTMGPNVAMVGDMPMTPEDALSSFQKPQGARSRDIAMIAIAIALVMTGAVLFSLATTDEPQALEATTTDLSVSGRPGALGSPARAVATEKQRAKNDPATLAPAPKPPPITETKPDKKPIDRPPAKRITKRKVVEPPPPKAAPEPALTESYVLSLKERAAEKGERDLVKALNDLWFGVVQGKTVTAGDRALVERAERALR